MDITLYSIYLKKRNNENIKEGFSVRNVVGVQQSIAPFIVSVVATYLCYLRNIEQPKYLRILYCILAFVFSGIYILYYFISNFAYSKQSSLIKNTDFSLLK